jgi:hypothetical protein
MITIAGRNLAQSHTIVNRRVKEEGHVNPGVAGLLPVFKKTGKASPDFGILLEFKGANP